MQTIFCDFETYYDDDYSLRKMTPVEYVLDPRYEAIGCAFKHGLNGVTYWVDGPDLQAHFDQLPQDCILVAHNMLFDGCIFAWRYGYLPRMVSDTLGISRAILGYKLRSLSLESVGNYLGVGAKGGTVAKVKGMRLADIKAAGLYDEYVDYSKGDTDICAGVWRELVVSGQFPMDQLAVMDMILRCCIQPKFVLDRQALTEHLQEVILNKEALLAKAMLIGASGRLDLTSSEAFAELLRSVGIEPPTKISPSTGQTVYAFAKSDADFMDLEEHPDERVQALVAARLGHKSTLAESRATRLLNIANLQWPDRFVTKQALTGSPTQALLPVPLKQSGAHTHRLSGDWKLNLQNLPARKGNALRRALTVQPDYEVVTVDSAQIQARLVATLCDQLDLVQQFANGEDVYASFASSVFGFEVHKSTHPTERFVGKQAVLGLGFGLGWQKFMRQLYIDSLNQTGTGIRFDQVQATTVVNLYRSKYSNIKATWGRLNSQGIQVLAFGAGNYELGPCRFEKGAIVLPSGLKMHYLDMMQDGNGEWRYEYAKVRKRTYGGSLLENIAQALEQVIMNEAAIRIQRRAAQFNVRLALQGHDELVYIVHKNITKGFTEIALEEMERRPTWMPNIPLKAEAGRGLNYGEAK